MILSALIINIVLIAIDQVTKYLALVHLKPVGSIAIIEGVFNLTFVENTGMAFGMLKGGRWFFVPMTAIILIGIYVYYAKIPRDKSYNKLRFAINLISAGAIGNMIDRVKEGYVIDFFHATFINFPVFNIADSCIVIGTIFLAILVIFFIKEE